MTPATFDACNLNVRLFDTHFYVPPIIWKGDSIGHIGIEDAFFWVLEGECFLMIDEETFLVRPGQLAYLPKGKNRIYTHASKQFTMYEISFSVTSGTQNVMDALGLCDGEFVVDIPDRDRMSRLFEDSNRKEMYKNPVYDIGRCANLVQIIKLYADARQTQFGKDKDLFVPIISYMQTHLDSQITLEQLAQLICMQPNYFIRRFRATFGIPPLAYLGRLRLYKAMRLLASTDMPIDQVAKSVGMLDTSYFSRFFKKNCAVSPSEYRNAFRRI